ncbi:ribosome biogenesis factor YjgA [Parathalassolituus penaei]|uniref:Dual-action ribosomal maturation protein DarP n=1 Tax=Parathalassolituus penaei TaxID=2997323 RepID=A0A9X3IT49_9GAMM|nr:ribosome biogenesis factor YjgA [Parathalassolituus penaei]MCY0965544.1 DUF615 domain-containing protein [Parathalassolituus penaei]
MKHYEDDYQDDEVSKSAVKREMERWQKLGERLTELNQSVWAQMPISETLRVALEENKRHKQHGARRRHLQYIGRLMRDENVDAIQEKLDLMDPSSEAYGRRQRQFELWRTRLVNEPDSLNEYIELNPEVDRQQLRNLVRNAQKEVAGENGRPGTAFKKLFQFIKGEASED